MCGSSWDVKDANVVCRELGLGRALTAPKTASERLLDFSRRATWLHDMWCMGSEDSINECDHSGWKNYCSDWDAGVECSRGKIDY